MPSRLLVVEDDAAITSLLSDVLTDAGYSVSIAGSGAAALEEMRKHLPDLVLLDLMLPDMNGWSFLHARERERDLASVPVLVISAAGPAGTAEAQQLGAPIFLAKPFDIHVLLEHVERLCSGSVRQCAWCRQVMDEAGEFKLSTRRRLRWATHGICPTCKERERQELLN